MNVKLGYETKLFEKFGLSFREAARGFLIAHRASGSVKPGTLESLEYTLALVSSFADANDWPDCQSVTTEHIEEYLAFFQNRRLWDGKITERTPSSAYLDGTHRRLKQFFAWQVRRGYREDNPLDLIPRPRVVEKMIAPVTERETMALLDAVNPRNATNPTDKFRRLRDRALLLLLVDTTGRRTELSDLRIGEVDLDGGGVTVMGKGSRQRWMPIGYTVIEAVWEYLKVRAERIPLTDRLWIQSEGKPMPSSKWIQLMLMRRSKEAGIQPVHAHQFRHAWIMAALRNKTPDQTIRAATGHRKFIPATYYRTLGEDDLAAAHREFSPADRLGQQNDNGWGRKKKGNARGRL